MNTTIDSSSSYSKQEISEGFRLQITRDSSLKGSHENHRKKRSKLNRIGELKHLNGLLKPKFGTKPGPKASKITRPCSECGKQFWSWKALFGHMRCHPERQWRGINPPVQFQRNPSLGHGEIFTKEDHEAAACLIMLANGSRPMDAPCVLIDRGVLGSNDHIAKASWAVDVNGVGPSSSNYQFEPSNWKKLFGSRQALGEHKASHKNMKGSCLSITKNDNGDDGGGEETMDMVLGHKCSICLRVFSSGQALGGHKRCHWEKGEEPSSQQGLNPSTTRDGCVLDLNLPAPIETNEYSSSSSKLALDLRLGI